VSGWFEETEYLTGELVRVTGIDGVGVAAFAADSTRDLVYASDKIAEEFDELQFTLGEGPCLDAYRFRRAELHDDILTGEGPTRWPLFVAEVRRLGAASIYAYPLRAGTPFGVLELYGRTPAAFAPGNDVPLVRAHDRRCGAFRTRSAVRTGLGTGRRVFPSRECLYGVRDACGAPRGFSERGDGTSTGAGVLGATPHHRDRPGSHSR
jgi:hypothetical protein